jgi:hypothetical protein
MAFAIIQGSKDKKAKTKASKILTMNTPTNRSNMH